jgi:hypothetical protein
VPDQVTAPKPPCAPLPETTPVTAIILLLALLCASVPIVAAGPGSAYAEAVPYILSTTSPSFFCAPDLTGSLYWRFSTDKLYVCTAAYNTGPFLPWDAGSWSQSADGVLTLHSKTRCANILTPALWLTVAFRDDLPRLPELRKRLLALLAANSAAWFTSQELDSIRLPGERYARIIAFPDRVRRTDLQTLLSRIDLFVSTPGLQNEQFLPVSHRGLVLMVPFNSLASTSPKQTCAALEAGSQPNKYLPLAFLIPESRFIAETGGQNAVPSPPKKPSTGWFRAP